MKLHYLIGDATDPRHKPAIIAHVCNDCNGFGAGFVVSLSKRYPKAKARYHEWFKTSMPGEPIMSKGLAPKLGEVQFVQVAPEDTNDHDEPEVIVANMIAQHDIRWNGKIPPIRYEALEKCLTKVYELALKGNLAVSMPRIGAVLSGGHWPTIEGIIKKTMTVETYVYTLESQKDRWVTVYEY